jgi:hypothetical protein
MKKMSKKIKKNLKKEEEKVYTDIFSDYNKTLMNKINIALEMDLKTMSIPSYLEYIETRISSEETKNKMYELKQNTQELQKSNYNIFYFNLLYSILKYHPKYKSCN